MLETLDVEARLRLVLGWARDTLADLALREKIKTDVEEGMEKTQREFLLRRQLDAIRKELGQLSGDGDDDDPDDYRAKIEARDLPEHVRKAVEREVDKLERTSDQSPETGWIRTWLDTVLEVPWGVESEDRLDIAEASRILEADHDGLEDVKERILEHLAVRKLQAERGLAPVDGRGSGAILALVGPPGVGKTSLGESVANALGRKFVRVSLGGVRDEAEIRGHRRTYVGAQPGRLVRALREAGTMNPVIVLDEVDKIGSDYRGDPSSALLEVLDPAQNHTFRDHYLEVDLDLSRVLFIATANVIETIPGAAARPDGGHPDRRLHRVREGLHRQAPPGAAASSPGPRCARTRCEVTDDALRADRGRLHPGGRRAEPRARARQAAAQGGDQARLGRAPGSGRGRRADDVRGWLGRPHFFFEAADRTSVPGVVTGLAVTGAGGDVLFVEASVSDGPEGLTLTGQLGDVMKESAEIALSYVRSHAEELGIDPAVFAGKRFHVHVPAGRRPQGRSLGRASP